MTGLPMTQPSLDDTDRAILRHLQLDTRVSLELLARRIGKSKTAVWNRIQRLESEGVIRRHVAIVDPRAVGLGMTVFVAIRTNHHEATWLDTFTAAIQDLPEIMGCYRMAGELDYILKVQVADTAALDAFYKRLVSRIDLYNVTSLIVMETIKETEALPLDPPPANAR